MLQPIGIITSWKIIPRVRPTALGARNRRLGRDERQVQHIAQFPCLQQLGIEYLAAVGYLDILVTLAQLLDLGDFLSQPFTGAENAHVVEHRSFQLPAYLRSTFFSARAAQGFDL